MMISKPSTGSKVKVSSNDTTADYLFNKLTAGAGIALAEVNDGADEDVSITSTITQYTDEMAQDAIGTILLDSGSIDFTYDDVTPSITAAVLPAGVDHSALNNLNTANYTHLTSVNHTDLTDAGDSALHYHSTDRDRANHTGTQTASTISDFNEAAQDAIGGCLTDSTTIDFTYSDIANTITAAAIYQMSITSDASGLKLSGDALAPGNNMVYGTDGAGAKGWKADPVAGAPGGADGNIQYNNGGVFGGSANLFWDDVNNYCGINKTPLAPLHVGIENATTNTILEIARWERTTSGIAATAGIGLSHDFYIENNAGNAIKAGDIGIFLSDVTATSEKAVLFADIVYAGLQLRAFEIGYEDNTFIGAGAGRNTAPTPLVGLRNFFGGSFAGYLNSTGKDNVYIGFQSGNDANGSYNTLVGSYAGVAISGASESSNVCIGYTAGYQCNGGNVMLGYAAGSQEVGSNKLYIANSNTTTPLIYGEFDTNILKFQGTVTVGLNGAAGIAGSITLCDGANPGATETLTYTKWNSLNDTSGIVKCDGAGAFSSAIAGTDYSDPQKIVVIKVIADTTTLTTGDGKVYWTVPAKMNGMNLIDADASVYTVSTAGLPTIAIYNLTQAADMLTTNITIDVNEYSSYTATTPPVIDGANDDIATGDIIRIDCDVAGTGTKGLEIHMIFL